MAPKAESSTIDKTPAAAAPPVDPTEKAVTEAAAREQEASAKLQKAQEDLAAAQAEHAEAKAAAADPEHMRDPEKFIVIEDGRGGFNPQEAPKGWFHDRSLNLGGRNYEHVSDDTYGRWVYRRM